jgi:hypothetical protein
MLNKYWPMECSLFSYIDYSSHDGPNHGKLRPYKGQWPKINKLNSNLGFMKDFKWLENGRLAQENEHSE